MLDAMVEEDECLVEFIDNVGGVEENCETSSTSIVHGNISNVENMHMQATTTNYSLCSCKFLSSSTIGMMAFSCVVWMTLCFRWGMVGAKKLCYIGEIFLKNLSSTSSQIISFPKLLCSCKANL
jgi:hypothetical protein